MNNYRRYFRVVSGVLVDAINKGRETNKIASNEYRKILKEIGAKDTFYHIDNKLNSIVFENTPDPKDFKRTDNGYYPKQNSKAGRALHKRLKSIKTTPESDCLESVGLSRSPTIFAASTCYFPSVTVIPSKPLVALVSVPWYDEDPEKLAKYIEDKKAGEYDNGNMNALLWEPTDEMVEIKEWQVIKEIEEWNESIDKNEAA